VIVKTRLFNSTHHWVYRQLAAVAKYVWVFCKRVPGEKMKPHPIPEQMKEALTRALVKEQPQETGTGTAAEVK
jgi:hypothetical protein